VERKERDDEQEIKLTVIEGREGRLTAVEEIIGLHPNCDLLFGMEIAAAKHNHSCRSSLFWLRKWRGMKGRRRGRPWDMDEEGRR